MDYAMLKLPIIVSFVLCGALSASDSNLLVNPGFESNFVPLTNAPPPSHGQISGQLGMGWQDNSAWAKVAVHYAQDLENPFSGKASQAVQISTIDQGMVQLVQPVRFSAGVGVRFSVWLRGRHGQSVNLLLRQVDAPWKSYGTSTAELSPEWREYRVQGIPLTTGSGFVMIQAGSPLAFQIDDARFEVLQDLVANAPARVGNLLTGGSFETVEPPFGWSTRRQGNVDWDWADLRQRTDNDAAIGQRSLRVDFQANTHFSEICSPVFVPNGERVHTASVWLKCSTAQTMVNISLDNIDKKDKDGKPNKKGVMVGTTWQRYTFTTTIPFVEWSRLRLSVYDPKGPFTLWIDGAMVEERAEPSADYVAAAPFDVTLTLAQPGHILHDGQTAAAQLEVAPNPPPGSRIELSVEDLLGGVTKLPALALPARTLALPELPGRPRGMFKLRAVLQNAAGTAISPPTELVWARLPKPRDLAPDRSYFGLHIPIAPDYLAMARAAGMRWVRMHDTSGIGKWPIAEPEAGRWEFHDVQVDAIHQAGMAVVGMLDGAPERVASRKRTGYFSMFHIPDLPGGVDQWRTYVRTVVGHYRGRIDYWEVWNEPWGQWWTGGGGTPELFAELQRAAYTEAKQANPAMTIIGINTMRGNVWTDKILALTGTDCFDAFSFHDYSNGIATGEQLQRQVEPFTAAMAKVGTPREQWNTEGGLSGVGSWYTAATGGMPPRTQVAYAIRYDVCSMAAGVRAFCMYAVPGNGAMGQTTYCCDEFDRAIRPVLAGRAVLASLVDGAGRPIRTQPQPGADCYTFPARDGKSVSVWWGTDGQAHQVPVTPATDVLDALGSPKATSGGMITIDSEPVFTIAPAAP